MASTLPTTPVLADAAAKGPKPDTWVGYKSYGWRWEKRNSYDETSGKQLSSHAWREVCWTDEWEDYVKQWNQLCAKVDALQCKLTTLETHHDALKVENYWLRAEVDNLQAAVDILAVNTCEGKHQLE